VQFNYVRKCNLFKILISVKDAFTHTMMKQSTEPEIVAVAKLHLNSEDYWNDLSDIEDLLKDEENTNNNINKNNIQSIYLNNNNLQTRNCLTKICVEFSPSAMNKQFSHNKNFYLNLQSSDITSTLNNPVSPNLSYFNEVATLPISPNTFVKNDKNNTFTKLTLDFNKNLNKSTKNYKNKSLVTVQDPVSPLVLRR
jgi:hypothetical protein